MFREDLGIYMNRQQYRKFKRMSEEDKKEFIHRLGWYIKEEEKNV